MPDFTFVARAPSGQQRTGVLTAGSEREVVNMLDQQGLFPIRIVLAPKRTGGGVGVPFVGRTKVKGRHLATLFAQLADLLHSGVPLLRSLEILEKQSSNAFMSEVLRDVRQKVADGTSLADAMQNHSRVFNELCVSMVRAGQEGGFLEDVLKRIAEFTDHQEDLKSKVVGALAYPVFLTVVGTVIVLALVVFLVPKFEDMFKQQKAELPRMTQTLLTVSRFLINKTLYVWNIVWVGVGVVGAWMLFRTWSNTPDGRARVDRWKLRIPLAGRIIRNLAIARFCRILGTMLRNGINLLVALRIAKDSTGNKQLSEAIEKAADNVTGGKTLAAPLAASGEFPKDIVEMVTVGEESNNLENVLIGIADSTERRTTRQMELAVRLLEPIMLLAMAAIVLMVVLALLMPFLQMGSTIK